MYLSPSSPSRISPFQPEPDWIKNGDSLVNERSIGELKADPHETEHVLVGGFEQNGIAIADHDDLEFEFPFVGTEANCSPVSADEIFQNGRIKPLYPVYYLLNAAGFCDHVTDSNSAKKPSGRVSLRMLMMEERDAAKSCSDDLQRVPLALGADETARRRRWKFRDLLHWSNGDGQDSLTPSCTEVKISGKGEVEGRGESKAAKEGEKRRSYKKGVMGDVNGPSRNLHPIFEWR